MTRWLILSLLAAPVAFAQPEPGQVLVTAVGAGGFARFNAAPVQGAPYSATITNESVQTLADGNRIVQSSSGSIARDSMGRTRQDMPLPRIGNMAPADAPHLVVIQDPVAQVSYTLNLTDKTAVKNPAPGALPTLRATASSVHADGGAAISVRAFAGPASAAPMLIQSRAIGGNEGQAQTEDLGSKSMEGISVSGTRTTRTIPAGQIGNDQPISIVTEVWTSPELKTVISSKRSDPRIGDETYQLTNIVRAEPDPALFTVPGDFKILDTPGPIQYKDSALPAQ